MHREERNFGLLFSLVFTLIAFWPPWRLAVPNLYWIAGACAWFVVALVIPRVLSPARRLWMLIGHGLGWINSRIILSIVFYGLIMPTSFLLRLAGHDPLQRHFRKAGSYWTARGKAWTPQSMKDQF